MIESNFSSHYHHSALQFAINMHFINHNVLLLALFIKLCTTPNYLSGHSSNHQTDFSSLRLKLSWMQLIIFILRFNEKRLTERASQASWTVRQTGGKAMLDRWVLIYRLALFHSSWQNQIHSHGTNRAKHPILALCQAVGLIRGLEHHSHFTHAQTHLELALY